MNYIFTEKDIELINKEFEDLRLAALKRCANQQEYDEVIKAFEFANEAHKGVRRRSGEPYIIHPISVAKIVVKEIGLGYKSIVTALLHDIVEDTDYTIEDIKRLFGEKIASLVDGLTKIKKAMSNDPAEIKNISERALQAENFKRILFTLNDDVRVVLIKLADRLHNIRTIESMPEYKKDKILSETMFIFAPLANRLGLYGMKSEMENIWLRTREPEAYHSIQTKIDKLVADRGEAMDLFITPIAEGLKKDGIDFKITKRTKTPYSIWHKMSSKGVSFEQIYDLYAVRIIFTPDERHDERFQCWQIFSIVTGLYPSKPDRIRDWVTKPKSNGYEALHCTIMSNLGTWVEVQIRSERMNEIAEKGVAAHWTYKDGKHDNPRGDGNEIDKWLGMVRQVLENPDVEALEFLDKFHETLLSNEIYVYTPKGESKAMPKNSTALDFAYSIHTNVGNKAIAAKANLKLVPLSYVLRNGDQIEIITAESHKPQREWLDFLTTNRAKSAILEAFKSEIKDSIKLGQRMLEQRLEKLGITLQSRVLKKLIPEYKVNNKEELYNKIGTGIIDLNDLEKILKKNHQSKTVKYWTLQFLRPSKEKDVDEIGDEKEALIEYDGLKKKEYMLEENPAEQSLSYRVADCCYPIPGDKIVVFKEDDNEVVVHKKTCPVAISKASIEGDKIINATWARHTVLSFLARITLRGIDRVGIVNDLTKFMTLVLNVNIRKILIETHDGIFEGYMDIYVHNTDDLDAMVKNIEKIKGVEHVSRSDIKEN